jgi:hypothetical protein
VRESLLVEILDSLKDLDEDDLGVIFREPAATPKVLGEGHAVDARENLAEARASLECLDERRDVRVAEGREKATYVFLWVDRGVVVDVENMDDDSIAGTGCTENIALGKLVG